MVKIKKDVTEKMLEERGFKIIRQPEGRIIAFRAGKAPHGVKDIVITLVSPLFRTENRRVDWRFPSSHFAPLINDIKDIEDLLEPIDEDAI